MNTLYFSVLRRGLLLLAAVGAMLLLAGQAAAQCNTVYLNCNTCDTGSCLQCGLNSIAVWQDYAIGCHPSAFPCLYCYSGCGHLGYEYCLSLHIIGVHRCSPSEDWQQVYGQLCCNYCY